MTKIFPTDCTVHFNSFNSRVQMISLVDLMTSSISLDADWSIVTQLYHMPLIHISFSM